MAETGLLLTIMGLTVAALPGIGASSLAPWFCHRLVPPPITSTITPCMYPCLFISDHEHPHIVVHSEVDGTLCKVTSGLHHETQVQVGRCSSGVCIGKMGPPVLKRKKRFICLITLAKLLKERRQRKLLQEELERLRVLNLLNYHRGVSHGISVSGSRTNFNRMRGDSSRRSSADTGGANVVEIHVIGPGAHGTGASNPRTGTSTSVAASVSSSVGGPTSPVSLGGHRINGGSNAFANERIGSARLISGSVDTSRTTGRGVAEVLGVGAITPGTRMVANIGLRNNGAGGAFAGHSIGNVGHIGAGSVGAGINGDSDIDTENRGGVAIAGSGTSTRNGAAVVAGIAGIGMNNGIRRLGGPGSLRNGAGEEVTGNLVGVGGVVSAAGTDNRGNAGLGVGSVGASYVNGGRWSAPGIGGSRSPFGNSDRSGSSGIAGRAGGTELESGAPRGDRLFEHTEGTGDRSDSDGFSDDGFRSDREFGRADGF